MIFRKKTKAPAQTEDPIDEGLARGGYAALYDAMKKREQEAREQEPTEIKEESPIEDTSLKPDEPEKTPDMTKELKGKRVKDSSVTMAQVMLPQDANPAGNVHGGVIMKLIDTAAAVVASRHARCNTVTVSIDRLDFHHPVFVGNLLFLKACLNMVGRTSLEVGVRVEAENFITGEVRHTSSAYLTFVALDKEGRPAGVPPLILESEEEERRNREAKMRREMRLALRNKEEQCGIAPENCK